MANNYLHETTCCENLSLQEQVRDYYTGISGCWYSSFLKQIKIPAICAVQFSQERIEEWMCNMGKYNFNSKL